MKLFKYILTFLLLGLSVGLMAQDTMPDNTDAGSGIQLGSTMTTILVLAAALLFIVAMIFMIRVNQFLYKRVVTLQAEQSGVSLPDPKAVADAKPKGDSFWTQMRKQYWEDAVPIDQEEDIVKEHSFDGIRELDNKLPPWWVNMFILTIIWAVGYMIYFHWGGPGLSQEERYEREMEQAEKDIAIALAGAANNVDESNVTALTESGPLGEGELIFQTNCTPCHGQSGGGNTIGPNLTDEYWIHGGGIKNVFRTVKNGVPEKGMIPWSTQLSPSDIQKVASYVLKLGGTNPADGKAPEGEIWTPEEEATGDEGEAASDSTQTSDEPVVEE